MERRIHTALLAGLFLLLTGCKGDKPPVKLPDKEEDPVIAVREAFPALTFSSPVDFASPGDGSGRLFVAEQPGRIRSFANDEKTGSSALFLDISANVSYGGERGLLGMAFHPDFANNGYFYVNYTRGNPLETVISRFKASGNTADPASEQVLLTYAQPQSNHNGGGMFFGKDGFLYIASGDGGGTGDTGNNAQNLSSLLGKILRIDVNGTGKGSYDIPSDNPFRGNQQGYREEIFAYGLRNPWRISFDEPTGTIWAGDVGQNAREEIDIIVKGGNYGWRKKEGNNCYNPSANCEEAGFVAPVRDYGRAEGDLSVTGGSVYRGKNIPSLSGKYIYGDYVSGRIWALDLKDDQSVANTLLVEKGGNISSFGTDENKEIYYCQHNTGKIMKLVVSE